MKQDLRHKKVMDSTIHCRIQIQRGDDQEGYENTKYKTRRMCKKEIIHLGTHLEASVNLVKV
jgi:hypothetical protein